LLVLMTKLNSSDVRTEVTFKTSDSIEWYHLEQISGIDSKFATYVHFYKVSIDLFLEDKDEYLNQQLIYRK